MRCFAGTGRGAVAGMGLAVLGSLGIGAIPGCSTDDEAQTCTVGTEGCPCTLGGACDPGFVCYSNRCVEDPDAAGGGAAGGGGDGSGADGGETGAEGGAPAGGRPGAGGGMTGGDAPTSGGADTGGGGAESGSGGEPLTGGAATGGEGDRSGGTSAGGAETGGEATGGDGPTTGGAETGGEAPTTGGAATGGAAAGGAAGAGAGGAPPALPWLTCANDECCFDTCGEPSCGVREFTSCSVTQMTGEETSICGGPDVCQDGVVILPSWFTERECVLTWMEGNYSPGSPDAYVFAACPCELEGYVVAEWVNFKSAEGGNVCDFAEVPDPACAGASLDTCL